MANGLFTTSWVYTGQQLKIPADTVQTTTSTPTPQAAPTAQVTSTPAPTPTATPAQASSASSTYVVRPGDTLSKIAIRHGVGLNQLATANGLHTNSWVYTGQRLSIPGTASTTATSTPPAQSHGEKWIDVNLSTQTVTAYSGQTALRSFIVSTGIWRYPTVVGTFRVYVKYAATRMRGPGYDLSNVPYTMYFHRGYALHGTYWHNNFGTPMSHGCINLKTPDAQWLYNWAPVGTKVVTHH
jgi:lipoprotein-anchoring transpeptidase ErfK/SrfK